MHQPQSVIIPAKKGMQKMVCSNKRRHAKELLDEFADHQGGAAYKLYHELPVNKQRNLHNKLWGRSSNLLLRAMGNRNVPSD